MRRVALGAVLIAVLLVGGDRVAAVLAQRGVATAVQQSQGLPQRPEVAIGGFPLLTQVLRGRYEQVDTSVSGLVAEQGVTIDRLDVRLREVQLPLSALLGGTANSLPVGEATATGLVGFPSLNAAARNRISFPGASVQFASGAAGRLAITGSYEGLVSFSISGEADVSIRGNTLVVSPVADTLEEVPALIRGPLIAALSSEYPLPTLPFGFVPREFAVTEGGVQVSAVAQDTVLR